MTSYFVYDQREPLWGDEAGHLIGEYDGTGKAIQETVWLGDTPVATVRPTADAANPQILYVWADHLNTPRQLSEPATQKLVWRWDGEPFGADLAQEGVDSKVQAVVYNLRFPGQYFDKETGLHYNYFRDYDPQTGRYIESDPIGLKAGSLSIFTYVSNSPLKRIDPLGLEGFLPLPWGEEVQSPSNAEGCGQLWDKLKYFWDEGVLKILEAWPGDAALLAGAAGTLRILEREGSLIVASFKGANGEARVIAEVVRDGDKLILRGAHIEGNGTLKEALSAAKELGRSQGAKEVVIEGGRVQRAPTLDMFQNLLQFRLAYDKTKNGGMEKGIADSLFDSGC